MKVFATLKKLSIIDLRYNQIEELPNGIFENNLNLEQIDLQYNNIKYLGTGMFNSLTKLNEVYLMNNICLNENYNGATNISQLKEDIEMYCKNPNEILTTTTTTSTTQNPMEVKSIEMQEKITKLEKELREAKELQQKNEAAAINERDALKKELREAKDLQQKNEDALTYERDALKQKFFDLNQNLFDTKRELQMFKITCGVIRNNLKKAKEDLVNCSNANPRALMLK